MDQHWQLRERSVPHNSYPEPPIGSATFSTRT